MTGTLDADLTSTAGDERVRVNRLVPVFAHGPNARAAVPLGGAATLVLGRDTGTDHADHAVMIRDVEVSRVHATIEPGCAESGSVLVDAGSRNGTFVDGVRTSRAELRHGTVVRMGRCLFVVVDVILPGGCSLTKETPALRGQSALMQRLRGDVAMVATQPMPVLIRGETGVGKGNVAAEIHRLSERTGKLVSVNCAAISAGLADTELFGHAAGAFTGATGASEGLFVAAHRGTLFLDEVGELPAHLQAKLLRAVGSGEIRAVGRSDARQVDVRIVAATNRKIEGADPSDFRSDLYARLSAWTVHVPPLRDRRDDVLRLAGAILERHGDVALSASAAEALLLFDWPYNVRQLENVLAAAAVRANGASSIRLMHLPDEIAALVRKRAAAESGDEEGSARDMAPVVATVSPPRPAIEVTAETIRASLVKHGGVKDRVWRELGLQSRFALRRLLKKHRIDDGAEEADDAQDAEPAERTE